MSPPAGKARLSCRSTTAHSRAGLPQPVMVLEPRRRRKRDLYRRRYRDRLRYGSGQRPHRRLRLAPARRSASTRMAGSQPRAMWTSRWWPLSCTIPISPALPPKSLDRQDFHARAKSVEALSDAGRRGDAGRVHDRVRRRRRSRHVPKAPRRWLVTGGGRRNAHFMQRPARPARASMSIRSRLSAGTAISSRRRPSAIWPCAPCAASP